MRVNVHYAIEIFSYITKKVSISDIFSVLYILFHPSNQPSIYKNRRLSSPHDSIHELHAIVKALNLYLNVAEKKRERKKNFVSVNI